MTDGLSKERIALILRYIGPITVRLPYSPRYELVRIESASYTFAWT